MASRVDARVNLMMKRVHLPRATTALERVILKRLLLQKNDLFET
jgi:hypothetical protein